mmetsp:Transcript_8348/g.19663  ORF Transcript_8348/g.19663 Transcript_8348/m.19663 type:complete len:167 (+) Transcript_8348:77-577(+)
MEGDQPRHIIWGGIERVDSTASSSAESRAEFLSRHRRSTKTIDFRDTSPLTPTVSLSVGPVDLSMCRAAGSPSASCSGAAAVAMTTSSASHCDQLHNLDSRWSEGSRLHASGKCTPCFHVWKRSSCRDGRACQFCHMCDEAKVREKRRARLAAQRHKRKDRRSSDD